MMFEAARLASGTGFIWRTKEHIFLITNWHNAAGIDPLTGLHLSQRTAAEPDRFEIVGRSPQDKHSHVVRSVHLRDEAGVPTWLEHPTHGRKVDVVAIRLDDLDNSIAIHPINRMRTTPMRTMAGNDIFILGYPLEVDEWLLPIWKRASVALGTSTRCKWPADVLRRHGIAAWHVRLSGYPSRVERPLRPSWRANSYRPVVY